MKCIYIFTFLLFVFINSLLANPFFIFFLNSAHYKPLAWLDHITVKTARLSKQLSEGNAAQGVLVAVFSELGFCVRAYQDGNCTQ